MAKTLSFIVLVTLILLGVASLVGNYLTLRKPKLTKSTAIVVLLIALVSFGMVSRTGYLGGQIRHTELNAGGAVPTGGVNSMPNQGGDTDGDDD